MDYLLKRIREMMNQYADELALGAAPDYSKYREMVGLISGLAIVEREILDQIERETRADFED